MNYKKSTSARNQNFLKTLEHWVKTSSMIKFGKQKIDLFTASLVLWIFEVISKPNQEKLLNMEIPRIIEICFKLNK